MVPKQPGWLLLYLGCMFCSRELNDVSLCALCARAIIPMDADNKVSQNYLYVSLLYRTTNKTNSIPLKVNKLTSPDTLESIDYPLLAICWTNDDHRVYPSSSTWKRSMESLHADAFYTLASLEGSTDGTGGIRMKQDVACQPRCRMDLDRLSDKEKHQLVQYGIHHWLDNMPTAVQIEDDTKITTRYWSGVPMARKGNNHQNDDARFNRTLPNEIYIYNHYNFVIQYERASSSASSYYRVIRTTIQPYSIQQPSDAGVNMAVASCNASASAATGAAVVEHTNYDMLVSIPPQPATGQVLFTYDVIWQEIMESNNKNHFKKRWDVFLTMDNAQPYAVKFLGVLVSLLICAVLYGSLWTWVMRDLSYKPVLTQVEWDDEDNDGEHHIAAVAAAAAAAAAAHSDDMGDSGTTTNTATTTTLPDMMQEELQMWPLSARVFFPPRTSPLLFCAACGTGAHLAATGLIFVVLFRTGIVSQSLWSNILTPAVVVYSVCAVVGGYMTGRLACLFHCVKADALKGSLITAICYPSIGVLVLYLVYDIFPSSEAPVYHVVSNSLPLMLIWFFCIVPLTLSGGWWGYRSGPLTNFPVSEGNMGYHDLDVQEHGNNNQEDDPTEKTKQRKCGCRYQSSYMIVMLLVGGILPVLGVFVSYAYDVAGPVFVGYYVDPSSFLIASYALFILSSCGVSMLLYYRQLRAQRYDWWWTSFVSGGSSGLYLFILTMTWLVFNISVGDVNGHVWALYTLWFAYTSLGAFLMTGFAGVLGCICLTRMLYNFATRQRDV